MVSDIHTFISAFFWLATGFLNTFSQEAESPRPSHSRTRGSTEQGSYWMLFGGPHQVNDCQTLSSSFISSDSYWCLQSTEGPDLRARFDTAHQWIINSSGSRKASASSDHDPSTMINQNAIISAAASHKMSPNSPSHKAQKASHRRTHTHTYVSRNNSVLLASFRQGYITGCGWSEKHSSALPPALQQLYMDLHHWKKSDICRIKSVLLISTAIHSKQPRKPAHSFRPILSEVTS